MNLRRSDSARPSTIKKSLRVLLPLILAAMAITLPKCGKTPTTSDPAPGTFTNVFSIITTSNCNQCHEPGVSSGAANSSTLDFTTATTAYATLTTQNVTSTDGAAKCPGVKIVNTTTPANSYLLAIFTTADQSKTFAGVSTCIPDTSHLTGTANITGDELTTITNWIMAGALND